VLSTEKQRSGTGNERGRAVGGGGGRALAVGAVSVAVMFVVVGAPLAGLVIVAVPAVAWVLSRYWRAIGTACEAAVLPMDGWVADGGTQRAEPAGRHP
jgi:hypothetical protein